MIAEQMEHREDSFGGEEPVGDEAHEERRDHTGQCCGAEDGAGLHTGEVQCDCQVSADGDVPGAPDDVIEKHHQAEARPIGKGHEGKFSKTGQNRLLTRAAQ
jgi:hypothetical protein